MQLSFTNPATLATMVAVTAATMLALNLSRGTRIGNMILQPTSSNGGGTVTPFRRGPRTMTV